MSLTFAAFLAACRESLQQTQAQIAERCAVTPEAISMFETGRRKPSLALLPCLADALRVDRRLLGRFALESRAPELYASLGLPPVRQEDLDSAGQRTPASHPLVEDEEEQEEVDSDWTQRAEGQPVLDTGAAPEARERPC